MTVMLNEGDAAPDFTRTRDGGDSVSLADYKGRKLVFMADLLPSIHHIPLPWVMAYDTRPLQTLREKKAFLEKAVEEEYVLFFEHDADHECATLKMTEKGVRLNETFALSDLG